MLRLLYAAVAEGARAAAALAPAREGKTWRALRARRGIRARYGAWGATGRDPARALLWLHAPSVGEGLQARPVLERLRAARPALQIAYTFFSPSAERLAASLGADFADYLPFDTAGDARAALAALRPRALVFAKLDVWPTLTRECERRGVRLGLISATLAESSGRRSPAAAALLREAYARLGAVGAIDPEDAERLVALGVRASAVTVTGDTRYDQVWARAAAADRGGALLAPLASDRPTLVAGSTWPSDDAVLLPAWARVRAAVPTARLIIAPHEPTPGHLEPVERWATGAGLRLARLGAGGAADADVVLVDRVGVLGELYALADAAYVGGAFHAAGLHSVLEPAAFGAPVAFGSGFAASRDARLLIRAGGGASAGDAAALATVLVRWLGDPGARGEAGERAREMVREGLGAADRSTALVEGLLDG
ncbi:MAG TPA: glycosyltransferase N-terminal domain-containing protein [Gemmatimonadaceae bacterium]